jgi:hypothetical protein
LKKYETQNIYIFLKKYEALPIESLLDLPGSPFKTSIGTAPMQQSIGTRQSTYTLNEPISPYRPPQLDRTIAVAGAACRSAGLHRK